MKDIYFGHEPSVRQCLNGSNCPFLHVSQNKTLHKPWIPMEKRKPQYHETTISMCVSKNCEYNHFSVSHFEQILFSNIILAYNDADSFDFAEKLFGASFTPRRDQTNMDPRKDYVKRRALFKEYLDSQREKIIIGHDTESNVHFDGTAPVLSLLQYGRGHLALVVCLLDYDNIYNSLFFEELHTNQNVIICTFKKEATNWLKIEMTNFIDLDPIIGNELGNQKSLKSYYEETFPIARKLNKTKRYQTEGAWERHYDKTKFSSYDALHYAAMDAIATFNLGQFYLS